ncbi:hypothetical protein DUNSADRAFT_8 [Dunaliella salina]|uniref:Uncharacterized protein n=1 Tax=Dunaliella salina TaxID=3046 RepID=A0ABQ7HAL6_DUNSA|nr:hypothetical protein DUNSADRAFT_8 [Dunaliella salina]|eukprot:KAF5843886.1 hypothetical protein DUNSADRAFT_8 [Dunaliella salina]
MASVLAFSGAGSLFPQPDSCCCALRLELLSLSPGLFSYTIHSYSHTIGRVLGDVFYNPYDTIRVLQGFTGSQEHRNCNSPSWMDHRPFWCCFTKYCSSMLL